jgi:hypothetical protein
MRPQETLNGRTPVEIASIQIQGEREMAYLDSESKSEKALSVKD